MRTYVSQQQICLVKTGTNPAKTKQMDSLSIEHKIIKIFALWRVF